MGQGETLSTVLEKVLLSTQGAGRNGRVLSGGGLDFLLGDIQITLWFSFLTAMTDTNLTLGNQSKGEKICPILGCKGLSNIG